MKVKKIAISPAEAGQRVDNYLLRELKGVPKSRVYRAIRKGEVRVNGKRVKAEYKLLAEDELRIPPIRTAEAGHAELVSKQLTNFLQRQIMINEPGWFIINKPSGMPVHGGTGIRSGLIEALRQTAKEYEQLELVHRLDRDTSGCLLVAKKRSALRRLHEQWRDHKVQKRYLALVKGHWPKTLRKVDQPLLKNVLQSGERMVVADSSGKESITLFTPLHYFKGATLVEANPLTGRTHQIRVHAKVAGHALAGDEKYGDNEFNLRLKQCGLNRLFLHAASLRFEDADQQIAVCATMGTELLDVLHQLEYLT